MSADEVTNAIEFSRMWNKGDSVEAIAKFYDVKPATVRSRVAAYRKKGIKLVKRTSAVQFTKAQILEINKAIASK